MPDSAKKMVSGNTSFAVPDTVNLPTGPTPPVPIPYPNVGQAAQALPATVRHKMEAAFNADLSDVRVYENNAPVLLGARAFTSGSDIFFAPGTFQPHSQVGSSLIAHELAHVIQQTQGRVNEAVQEAINDNSASDAND